MIKNLLLISLLMGAIGCSPDERKSPQGASMVYDPLTGIPLGCAGYSASGEEVIRMDMCGTKGVL